MTSNNSSLKFKTLPAHERPRERLLLHGADALSSAELIAILLRTGTSNENVVQIAEKILLTCGGLSGLARATPYELSQIKGLGQTKVTQLLAVIELAKRLMTLPIDGKRTIDSAEDAAQLLADMQFLTQENVKLLILDSMRCVVASPTIYIGTLNTSILRIAEVFREVIMRNSPAFVIAHNHPSGDPTPSAEDYELTHSLVAAGKLLDIQVLDHLIMGHNQWVSLKTLGVKFDS